MKDPTGKSAPAGGFQNLGWYSGYQYYNGSFAPQAGMIHPQSPQQGAGSMVSPEVNRQTSVAAGLAPDANQKYVDALNAKPAVNPSAFGSDYSGIPTSMTPGGTTGAGIGDIGAAPTIDLPSMYKNLYSTAGIDALQKQLDEYTAQKTETEGKINDNPFLSEATRVGRVAKLEDLYNQRTANLQNQIATKKADIEMQLNLATKQFDINSQAARDNLDRFNTLLQSGALNNASGDDIANLTRATGLSSQAIYSAVNAQKQKNRNTQVITATDDNGNVTAVVMDQNTGEIIAKNSLGSIGNKQNGGSASAADKTSYYSNALRSDAQKGLTLSQIFGLYTGYLEPDLIYQLYNANSKYGPDKGSVSALAKYGVTQPKTGLGS